MDVVTLGMANAAASRRFLPRSRVMAVLGDSLTEQGGEIPANPDTRIFVPWTWANVLLNQALSIPSNNGIGGQTTTQIRARIGDVLALSPGWVHLLAGTNNMGVANGVADAKTDITAMLDTFNANGIRVVLGTIPPRLSGNYTGTTKADTYALNEWIRSQARIRANLIVVDYFVALEYGGGGNYQSTIYGFNPTVDGIHLSATGGYLCGKVLADALRPHIGSTTLVPYSNPAPGANLLPNPRPGVNGAAAPTSITVAGTGAATAVWSDVTRADSPSKWKQVVIGNGLAMTMNTNATVDGTTLAIGDVVNGIVEFDVSAMEQSAAIDQQGIAISLRPWNGATYSTGLYAFNYFRGPNVDRAGVLRTPNFTVPAGTISVALFIELRGGMTFKFDRAGIYNRKTYPV